MYFWDLKTKALSFIYLFKIAFDEFQVLVDVPFPIDEFPFPMEDVILLVIPWLEIDLVGYI